MIEKRKTAAVSPEDVLFPEGQERRLIDAISIDFALIPDHTRDELAATTLDSVRSFLQQPGGREQLDARIAAKKKAAIAATKGVH